MFYQKKKSFNIRKTYLSFPHSFAYSEIRCWCEFSTLEIHCNVLWDYVSLQSHFSSTFEAWKSLTPSNPTTPPLNSFPTKCHPPVAVTMSCEVNGLDPNTVWWSEIRVVWGVSSVLVWSQITHINRQRVQPSLEEGLAWLPRALERWPPCPHVPTGHLLLSTGPNPTSFQARVIFCLRI